MLEKQMQRAAAKYLDILKLDIKYRDKYFWFHCPSETGLKAGKGYYMNRYREGVKPGIPDIIIFLENGKTIFIELKVDKSSLQTKLNTGMSMLSQHQRDFKIAVEQLGFDYYIVCSRGITDCIDSIKSILDLHI